MGYTTNNIHLSWLNNDGHLSSFLQCFESEPTVPGVHSSYSTATMATLPVCFLCFFETAKALNSCRQTALKNSFSAKLVYLSLVLGHWKHQPSPEPGWGNRYSSSALLHRTCQPDGCIFPGWKAWNHDSKHGIFGCTTFFDQLQTSSNWRPWHICEGWNSFPRNAWSWSWASIVPEIGGFGK